MKKMKKQQSGQLMIRGAVVMGSVVSFIGLHSVSAFSEPLRATLVRLFKEALATVLLFAGSFAGLTSVPQTFQTEQRPVIATRHIKHTPEKKSISSGNSGQYSEITMISEAPQEDTLDRYTYVFSGKATHESVACPEVSVLIRVSSSDAEQTKSVITDAEGNYSIPFYIYARRYEPIHWSIEAHAAHSNYIRFAGQRISMREEDSVKLKRPLAFARLTAESDAPNPFMHDETNNVHDLE
jgi:hypothetical protein